MFQEAWNCIQARRFIHYNRLASHTVKQKFSITQLKTEGFFSLCGQDKWITEILLPNKKSGTFVDIGAYDGITLSNTYFLEQKGWTGVAVEPIPYIYERLVKNRQCAVINGCLAKQSGKKQFRVITGYSQMLSGLVDEYDQKHVKRIRRELDSHGGKYNDIEINCYNFNELLGSYGVYNIDYLTIDAEGAELSILESINFDRFQISIIGVENNYSNYRIPELMSEKGFTFHSIVGDEFYVNEMIV